MLRLFIRPGFIRSRYGAPSTIAAALIALIGQSTSLWRLSAAPLLIIAIVALVSGDDDAPQPGGKQQKPQSIQGES